jgi:hypothetical protein
VCVHSDEIAVLVNMQEEKDLLVCQISDINKVNHKSFTTHKPLNWKMTYKNSELFLKSQNTITTN